MKAMKLCSRRYYFLHKSYCKQIGRNKSATACPCLFLFIVPSLLNGDAPVHLHQVRHQSAHYPSDPCSVGYSILLIVLSFQPVLLLWQRVQPAQCGLFDTMQIAEKNREMISGITGNMHDGYDIIFKDGHSCHCRTKKDIRSCIIEYCNEKGD